MSKCKYVRNIPPVYEAVITNNIPKLQQVLRDGDNPNVCFGNALQTPLHKACTLGYERIVQILLKHGSCVNFRDMYGNTPLHLAASHGYTQIVKQLIDANARVEELNVWNQNPLFKAAEGGHGSVANVLLSCDDKITSRLNQDVLTAAVDQGHYHIIALLSNLRSEGWKLKNTHLYTSLIKAIMNGNMGIAMLLIGLGAPVDLAGAKDSPLTPLSAAIISDSLQIAKALICLGADLDAVDAANDKPLLQAVKQGRWSIAKEIIGHSADDDDLLLAWKLAKTSGNDEICRFISNRPTFQSKALSPSSQDKENVRNWGKS